MGKLNTKQDGIYDYLFESNSLIYEAMEYNWHLTFEYKAENNNKTITGTAVFIDYQKDELHVRKLNGLYQHLSVNAIKKVYRNR